MIIFLSILLGVYLGVGAVSFIFLILLVILGGDSSYLWFPFVAAPLWPVFAIVYLTRKNWQ